MEDIEESLLVGGLGVSPPPTSGLPQVEEDTVRHWKTKNSMAAGIGVGINIHVSIHACTYIHIPPLLLPAILSKQLIHIFGAAGDPQVAHR